VYTDEYGIETDGFTDENEDSVIATIDEKDKVLTTTYTSFTRVTSPVVAVTSYFDSIVAVVALVATVFGIYELSTICATAVATASSSNTSSYPEQLNIPVYLLLTAIVGAITLTVAILLLRRPIGTSIGDSNEANDTSIHKICKPAGESEHYYETGPDGRSGRPAVPRHLRPAAPRTSPTLRAFVDQYRRTAAELDALNASLPSVSTLSRMSDVGTRCNQRWLHVPDLSWGW
jgi:hypothetical protein